MFSKFILMLQSRLAFDRVGLNTGLQKAYEGAEIFSFCKFRDDYIFHKDEMVNFSQHPPDSCHPIQNRIYGNNSDKFIYHVMKLIWRNLY